MCTAISHLTNNHYFGRNLDLEYHYNEEVVITPRHYPIHLRNNQILNQHYCLIGIATVIDGYPLYYDCTNEYGLSIAALNFPGNAVYNPLNPNKTNITPFELPLWILGNCRSVSEAFALLEEINIWNLNFNNDYPLTPLHWLLSDKEKNIVIEPLESCVKIYDNPIGVLTNNPPFEYHIQNISNYLNISSAKPTPSWGTHIHIEPNSHGSGTVGLPGDYTSASRFVRATYVKCHSQPEENPIDDVGQFFHILSSVHQQKGCVKTKHGLERTIYTSCCDTEQCIYYYTTYTNNQICAISMHHENLDNINLVRYPLNWKQQIYHVN